MQRKDILQAIAELTQTVEKSGILNVLRPERSDKAGRQDAGTALRSLRDYSVMAASFKPATRSLTRIFKLDPLEDPEVWVQLLGGSSTMPAQLARSVLTLRTELPKILTLLTQESVPQAKSPQDESIPTEVIESVRITFVEDEGQFSTVQRVVEGLTACQEIYDGLQRLTGDSTIPLAIGAIDSGSDKSFDLFGAAALMKEFRELVVSLWGLVVFHREHKLGRRLELLASALPILERVSSLEQANRLGREEAQIIRNAFVEGTKKFVAAGVLTDDLEFHATHNPRALLAPEPKLLTGPTHTSSTETDATASATASSGTKTAGSGAGRNLSDADLERLAELMSERSGTTRDSKDSPEGLDDDPNSDA